MKRINRYFLMATAVLGLGMGVVSCFDNIDNNGGKTPENQEEIMQEKADKFWSVVSQLVSTDDYTPDYEGKTFEPVYGVAQEGDPTTRLVYTNDAATAAERFADIVEVEGIDENTQTYTFNDPDIGTLTYTKGDEDGAILATVDVDIKQIPSLKKILYVPGVLSNGHFEGKAYYRFGDVVSRQTTDYDGNAATEYWVCVRPAFGPEGKEESHWVCLNVLPKKNVYHYKGSNGTDYYLPTGLGTNKEHMQNLAEMIYAIINPKEWYQNVTQHAKDGLKMFHDFSAANIKYHNQNFWQNVQDGWENYNIFRNVFGMSSEKLVPKVNAGWLAYLYKGYSWWTTTSWNCSLWVANYRFGYDTDYQYRNMHNATYEEVTMNMRNIHFDCRKMGPNIANYSEFLNDYDFYWAVRHATGKELCANGRYDVKQPLNGCEEVYRYYRDVEPIADLSEDPEVTLGVSEAPTDGRGTYQPGDVVKDQNGNRFFCITASPWSPEHRNADRKAWFVSTEYNNINAHDIVKYLPTEAEVPELAARLMDGFLLNVMNSDDEAYRFDHHVLPENCKYGKILEHVKEYAGFDWRKLLLSRDSTLVFNNTKGEKYYSESTSYMFNLAYRDANDEVALLRVIRNNTLNGTDADKCQVLDDDGQVMTIKMSSTDVTKYYQVYDTTLMRQPTSVEKQLKIKTWCLPWAVSQQKMYLKDLADANKVKLYAKDKWVTLPWHGLGAALKSTFNILYSPIILVPDVFINTQNTTNGPQYQFTGMYREPVLFLQVMKVIDEGGILPKRKDEKGNRITLVHMQNDKILYDRSLRWLENYPPKHFNLDNQRLEIPSNIGD